MIISMTGYGQSTNRYKEKQIQVEIKSLNGKSTDLRLRVPLNYREKEVDLRKLILGNTNRGKLDASVLVTSAYGEESYSLNKSLFTKYHKELSDLQKDLGIQSTDIVQAILRIPNVVSPVDEKIDVEEWELVQKTAKEAMIALESYRAEEGKALELDLMERVKNIKQYLDQTEQYEEVRIERVKQRLKKNLQAHLSNEKIDENRFEQEMLFYIEKLDITEEKVRLTQHCKYFLDEVADSYEQKGKKLGFISQEMGREINTLGAKSQHSDLQQIVVNMKDELEKIKEQIANIV